MEKIAFQIRTFEPSFSADVAGLVLDIQQKEFNVPVTLESQPDLQDVRGFFQKNDGNFWIAAAGPEQKVVGTIGLLDCGEGIGCLRKMFVHRDFRGKETGLARQLLETLEQWSATHGIYTIYLGTIERLVAANRFYLRNGFALVEKTNLPASFPMMSVDTHFYVKRLGL